MTTGDVAEILERRYGIMRAFYENQEVRIGVALANSVAAAIEDIVAGAPPARDPFAEGASKIETLMKQFISTGAVEHVGLPNVPTQASLMRRAGRAKRYGTRGLTSFIDSGLYESSMRAWVD